MLSQFENGHFRMINGVSSEMKKLIFIINALGATGKVFPKALLSPIFSIENGTQKRQKPIFSLYFAIF